MFIRDILSQKRYLPVKLAIVAVIASFIAVLSFHISRSSGVSTFNGTVTNDTDVAGNTGSQKKMSYVSVTIQQNDSLWSIAKKYKNQYDKAIAEFLEPFSEAVRSQIEDEVECLFHQLESMELTIKGNREPRNPQ